MTYTSEQPLTNALALSIYANFLETCTRVFCWMFILPVAGAIAGVLVGGEGGLLILGGASLVSLIAVPAVISERSNKIRQAVAQMPKPSAEDG